MLRGVEAPHADDHLEADVGDGYEGEGDAVRLVGDLVGDEGGKDGEGDPGGVPEGDDVVELWREREGGRERERETHSGEREREWAPYTQSNITAPIQHSRGSRGREGPSRHASGRLVRLDRVTCGCP